MSTEQVQKIHQSKKNKLKANYIAVASAGWFFCVGSGSSLAFGGGGPGGCGFIGSGISVKRLVSEANDGGPQLLVVGWYGIMGYIMGIGSGIEGIIGCIGNDCGV